MGSCVRCGIDFLSANSVEKWIEEKREFVCFDCKRAKVKQIKYKFNGEEFVCRPWHGDFDSEDYPIDDRGVRFTGEAALCGHRDCIALEHRPEMKGQRKNKPVRDRSMRSFEAFLAVAEARGQL